VILVVAPSIMQARSWAAYEKLSDKDWRHVTNRDTLRGYWKPQYVVIDGGAVMQLDSIMQELRVMGAENYWGDV
jgi:hypothetical protein